MESTSVLGVVGSFVEVTNFVGATVEVGSEVGCGVAEGSGGVVDVHVGGSDAGAGVLDMSPPGSTPAPRVQADARAKMSAKKMSRDILETDQRGFRQARWDWPRSSICSLNVGSSFQSYVPPRNSIATAVWTESMQESKLESMTD